MDPLSQLSMCVVGQCLGPTIIVSGKSWTTVNDVLETGKNRLTWKRPRRELDSAHLVSFPEHALTDKASVGKLVLTSATPPEVPYSVTKVT
jgi:hypothetical protein